MTRGEPATEIPVSLDREAGPPLAVQLADALRAAAVDGLLRAGDRLPATRRLAAHLGVSRTVTTAAYEQLHAEGWLTGRHGSGTYVTTSPPTGAARQTAVDDAEPEAVELVDLTPGAPWSEGIDRAAWRRAWRASAEVPPMTRPRRAGLPEYRAVVAEHLLRHRGLAVPRAHEVDSPVIATAGTTAGLVETVRAVLRPGDVVAVEEPGYQRAVGALLAAGLRVVPAPVDGDGLLVERVPTGVRAVYCSPAHQYPLGGRLPAARRVALVERARRDGFLVIEDDYDGELRYDVAPLPLLAALAPEHVVHLGTTSKILTPTLGVGWMVAPASVRRAVLDARDRSGVGPAAAGQRVLVELARHGDLGRHLRRTRREFARRRGALVDAFTSAGLPVLGDEAGAHLVLPLPSAAAEQRVIGSARRAGLALDGLGRHHQGPAGHYGIALGYAACSSRELASATPVLTSLVAAAW
ncbi:PLP-dependent aminotransferase family protein [Actinoalloteichus spitiensis]|uniref:aminotransferase-like domain-containing protein n=1 Tax=Actinoalloteichus spitiensis TaxID=252394 RepID=UPI00038204A6|nr:PLP-dependent aminotransferase family protein [Actinoalloteichus spitiensis]